jgi:hypothetical protein
MAYALKYYHNFHQLKSYAGASTEYRIEVYLEGYGGGSSEIDNIAAGSINLSRSGDMLDNVLGTQLTFGIYNETEGQYKEFRTAAWGDYMVKLIYDPNGTPEDKFIGYNQSEIYTEPYDQPPYMSKLEFTCGLSHLKNVRFDDNGTLYTGQKTIIEVLRLALNKLPNPVKIREFINVYEDNISSTTTDSMINQIYVNSNVYRESEDKNDVNSDVGFFCHEVIEAILKPFNAHIFTADGIWYIVRTQEYTDSTMYWRQFNANVGTEGSTGVNLTGNFTSNKRVVTGTNGLSNELVLQAQATEMSIDPPLNRVKVTYNQDNLDLSEFNLIRNSGLDLVTNNGFGDITADFWTLTGESWVAYLSLLMWQNKWWFSFERVAQRIASGLNTSIYLSQSKIGVPTATTDSLQLTFDFWFIANVSMNPGGNTSNHPRTFLTNNMYFRFPMEIKVGSYYLSGDANTPYAWTLTPSVATMERKGLDHFTSNVNDVYDFILVLPTLPENGIRDFDIKIFRPYTNWYSYSTTNTDYTMEFQYLRHRDVILTYLPDEAPPVEELILYSKVDEDENLEEIDVMHGDGTNTVSMNSFRLSTGVITDEWNRRGVTDNAEILTILLRQFRDLRSEFLKVLNGNLIADLNFYNTIEDTTDVTTHYWMREYDWAIEVNEWSVGLMELRDDSATIIDTDIKTMQHPLPTPTVYTTAVDTDDPISSESVVTTSTPVILDQQNTNDFN